jgi:hypothetical protein
VKKVDNGDFKLDIRSKYDDFEWILVSLYGAAQDDLIHMFGSGTVPAACHVFSIKLLVNRK